MEQIKLKATVREQRGTQAAKKMRREGSVPGVVYHRGEKSISIAVSGRELSHIVNTAENENILINLSIDTGKKAKDHIVLVKELQHDPIKRNILHVDFNEISLKEKITVQVEIVAKGEPIGVKQGGGLLEHTLRTLEIECLPTEIPPHIDVDVSGLVVNGAIHVSDLHLPANLKIVGDPDRLLFQVKLPVEEKVEDATAEVKEVEVTREKKEEEAAPGKEAKPEAKKEAKPEAKEDKSKKK